MVPCERIFVFENGQFPRYRPQEVMQYLTYFSDVLLKRMARAARKMFQYTTHSSYGFVKKKRKRAARKSFEVLSHFSQFKNRPESVCR